MKTDEDFRARVTAVEDSDKRKALTIAEGFDFTREEIESVVGELSDEEMDLVSGGGVASGDISEIMCRSYCWGVRSG